MTKGNEIKDVEILSSRFHDIYMREARRQGDVRHKDKYEDLTENIKDFDRVLARDVIGMFKDVQEKERNRIVDLIEGMIKENDKLLDIREVKQVAYSELIGANAKLKELKERILSQDNGKGEGK